MYDVAHMHPWMMLRTPERVDGGSHDIQRLPRAPRVGRDDEVGQPPGRRELVGHRRGLSLALFENMTMLHTLMLRMILHVMVLRMMMQHHARVMTPHMMMMMTHTCLSATAAAGLLPCGNT